MFVDGPTLVYGSLANKDFMEKYFPSATWVGGGLCNDDD